MEVFLKDIRGYYADLIIKSIHEKIPVEGKKPEEKQELEKEIEEKSKFWLWFAVGLVIVMLAVIIRYKSKKKLLF